MERETAESFERIETTVADLTRSIAQHVEASDARMDAVEMNLTKLSDTMGNFARSMNDYVEAADTRMKRLEEAMTRMEQDFSALVNAITAGRGSSQSRG